MSTANIMKSGLALRTRLLRVVVLLGFATLSIYGLGIGRCRVETATAEPRPEATPRRETRATPSRRYSEFPHNVKAHAKECGSCHKFPSENWNKVRTGEAAFPDITEYPRHESCLSCHRQQFFKGSVPAICSICHTAPGPRNSSRHPFPNPREIFDASSKGRSAISDFAIGFSHEKHMELVSATPSSRQPFTLASFERPSLADENCAICHTTYKPQGDSDVEFVTDPPQTLGDAFWLKKGTFKTVPVGHTQCFTCHSVDSGVEPAPASCATCHKLKPAPGITDFDPRLAVQMKVADKQTLQAWRSRDSSATFRHEWLSHAELACSACHNVNKLNTLEAATKKVAIGSCSACHITATAGEGGVLNLEIESRKANARFQCVKCHAAFGKLAVPVSHSEALAAAAGK